MNVQDYTRKNSEAWELVSRLLLSGNGPTISEIAFRVAAETGVTVAEMRTSTRVRSVARARQVAMFRARREGKTLEAIGRFFNRDHTTVLHAVALIERVKAGKIAPVYQAELK